jgi:hypothetical protein
MITINRFQVSADMKTLIIQVTAASGFRINSLKLSTDETYLDAEVDLTSKLLQIDETEDIVLIPSDLGLNAFNGIYFATFATDEIGVTPVIVAACNFSQFFYAINDSLTKIDADCITCNDHLQNALIMDLYLEGLKSALIVSKYTNAIINFYALKKLCSGSIDACLTGCTSGYGVLDGAFVLV